MGQEPAVYRKGTGRQVTVTSYRSYLPGHLFFSNPFDRLLELVIAQFDAKLFPERES